MSFIELRGPHYIKRTLIFVNSNQSNPIKSSDNFFFTYDLVEELQNVFALELVQYNIPWFISPTFLGIYDFGYYLATASWDRGVYGSNMMTDIRFTDETGLNTLTFYSSLDPGYFLIFIFAARIPYSGNLFNPDFILAVFYYDVIWRWYVLSTILATPLAPGTYSLNAPSSASLLYGNMWLYLYVTATPTVYGSIEFLYGTGMNKANSTARVFGFIEFYDTVPLIEYNYGVYGDYQINPKAFRYMDIDLLETPELQPFARIPTVSETIDLMTTPINIPPSGMRLLKRPLNRLKQLSFRISTAGQKPSYYANLGMDFTIQAYSLNPIPKIPDWVTQRLTL